MNMMRRRAIAPLKKRTGMDAKSRTEYLLERWIPIEIDLLNAFT